MNNDDYLFFVEPCPEKNKNLRKGELYKKIEILRKIIFSAKLIFGEMSCGVSYISECYQDNDEAKNLRARKKAFPVCIRSQEIAGKVTAAIADMKKAAWEMSVGGDDLEGENEKT